MGELKTQSDCHKAMVYYYDYLSNHRDRVPGNISEHIQGCLWCQRELHLLEEIDLETGSTPPLTGLQTTHLELHFALSDHPVACSDVKAFLPILAIPEQQVTIPTPVTVHIGHCRQCAGELNELMKLDLSVMEYGLVSQMFSEKAIDHTELFSQTQIEVISKMLQRPDSGVVTTFQFKPSSATEQEQSYEVKVAAQGVSSTGNSDADISLFPATTLSRVHQQSAKAKWYLRPLAAAAILMVGFFLFFNNSSLKATDISQIYETLKAVANVSMAHYGVDSSVSTQQIWVSRSLKMKLVETGERVVLLDTGNSVRYTKTLSDNLIQSTEMSEEMLAAVDKTMDVPWGLLPFDNVADLPEGAVWQKVRDRSSDAGAAQFETYILSWTEETVGGPAVYYQWRCMLDPVTKRPLETHWWSKQSEDSEYELTTRTEIHYPEEIQIQTIVSKFGFQR